MSHLSREVAALMPIYSLQNFTQFCVSYVDLNGTDISTITAQSDGELYARGRSCIPQDTGILGDVTFIARNRHTGVYIFNGNFTQFCVSYVDDNLTDISVIPARFCREKYARGRSFIICDTGILGHVTFIARSRRINAYILNAKFYPILR